MGRYKKPHNEAEDLEVKQELWVTGSSLPWWTRPTWTTQELRIFCHFDKSLILFTTTSTDTQSTPKSAEYPNNLLNVPSCCWYAAWSSCRECVTTQCPAASLGQADEVRQTQLALQWLMLFFTPPDTLIWQTRMNEYPPSLKVPHDVQHGG